MAARNGRAGLPRTKSAAKSRPDSPEIPSVGTGIAPVAGHDRRSPDANTGGTPERKHRFQKRLAEKVEQSLDEHPDGSAPPLDRLTQDLDPNKDL